MSKCYCPVCGEKIYIFPIVIYEFVEINKLKPSSSPDVKEEGSDSRTVECDWVVRVPDMPDNIKGKH